MCVTRGIPLYPEIVGQCIGHVLERLSDPENVLFKSVVESFLTLGSTLSTHL